MKRILIFGGLAMALLAVSCKKDNITTVNTTCTGEPQTPVVSVRSDEDPVPMRGHVRGSGGSTPISGAGASLTKAGQSNPAYSTSTDSNGSYSFGLVEQGSYTLRLSATGYITKSIPLNLTVSTERTDTLIAE